MKATGEEVRVVIVSSKAHCVLADRFNFSDPGNSHRRSAFLSYGMSKLANVLHARELARRENAHLDGRKEKPQVVAVSLHPGSVATEVNRNMNALFNFIMTYVSPFIFSKTVWQGTQTSLHCILDPGVAQYNGAYFADCEPTVTSYGAQSNDDARDLWRLSEELVAPFMDLI